MCYLRTAPELPRRVVRARGRIVHMRIGNRVGRGWIIGPALAGVVLMVSGCGGEDGASGKNGSDGTSCKVSQSGSVSTISCEDGETAEVSDGEPGEKGDQGEPGEPGADGENGADGADGEDGVDGRNSLMSTEQEPPGANCANGGYHILMGLDDDRDGRLDGA